MAKPQKKKIAAAKKIVVLPKIDYRWPSFIAVIAFGLYFNTLHHGYVLDDSAAITQNQLVQKGFDGISGLLTIDFWHFANLNLGYYRPLALITFAIEHQLFGSAPHISHLVNILLYAFTGFMLCLLLMDWFSVYYKVKVASINYLNPRLFAFLITLLFIAYPAHTEVVANLKSRDEILSFLGIISVLFIMFRYDGSKTKRYLIVSLVIYYLAMLSKESAVTGAILLPAMLYFFRERSIAECIKKAIPFGLVVILFYLQKYAILGSQAEQAYYEINNYPYAHAKFASSFVIFVYCIKLLFLPHPLIYDYSYNMIPAGSGSNPLTLLGLLLFCFLVFLAMKGFFQRKVWGFALVVFFVTLLPALGFVWLRGGIMAERFLYAPALAFCMALVYFLALAFNRLKKSRESRAGSQEKTNGITTVSAKPIPHSPLPAPYLLTLVGIIFALYSFKTIDRNKAWKDNETLFITDLPNTANSAQNNRHYGHELLEKAIAEKDTAKKMALMHESLFYLHRAVEINHRFGEVWGDLGRAYYDLKYNPDSAILFFRTAIDVTPNAYSDYSNLGLVYRTLQKYRLASFYFNMAAAINPNFMPARNFSDELKRVGNIDVREYPGGENPALSYLQLPTLTVPGPNHH